MNFDRTITRLISIFCIAQILKFQVPFYKKFLLKYKTNFYLCFSLYILRVTNTKIILPIHINLGQIMWTFQTKIWLLKLLFVFRLFKCLLFIFDYLVCSKFCQLLFVFRLFKYSLFIYDYSVCSKFCSGYNHSFQLQKSSCFCQQKFALFNSIIK